MRVRGRRCARALKLWFWTSKIMPDLWLVDLFLPIKKSPPRSTLVYTLYSIRSTSERFLCRDSYTLCAEIPIHCVQRFLYFVYRDSYTLCAEIPILCVQRFLYFLCRDSYTLCAEIPILYFVCRDSYTLCAEIPILCVQRFLYFLGQFTNRTCYITPFCSVYRFFSKTEKISLKK